MKWIVVVFFLLACGKQEISVLLEENTLKQSPRRASVDDLEKATELTASLINEALEIKEYYREGGMTPSTTFINFFNTRFPNFTDAIGKLKIEDPSQVRIYQLNVLKKLKPEQVLYIKDQLETLEFPKAGELRTVAPVSIVQAVIPGLLYTPEEATKILGDFTISPRAVKYNGVTGFVDFLDAATEKKVDEIAFLIEHYNRPEKNFLEVLRSLPLEQQKFLNFDSNTQDPSSRIEPIDLIASKHKNRFLATLHGRSFEDPKFMYDVNTLMLKSFLSVALRHKLSSKPAEADLKEYGLMLFKNKNHLARNHIIVCYDRKLTIYGRKGNEIGYFNASYGVTNFDLDSLDKFTANVRVECGDLNYRVEREVKKGEVALIPEVAMGERIKAISTIALVSEMNAKLRTLAFLYLNAKGFKLGFMKDVTDLKRDFMADAADADVIIPVTHSLRVEDFLLGAHEGYKVTASKNILNQITKKMTAIDFTIYFPPSSEGPLSQKLDTLNLNEVAELIAQRDQFKKNSLFVLNTSCFSEKTIDTWMFAWEMATKKQMSQALMPVIVGSKKGFATDNAFSILAHLEYPINALEELGRGGKAVDVLNILKEPPRKTSKVLRMVEQINLYYKMVYGTKAFDVDFEKGFEPIINTQISKYFDGTKEEFVVFKNERDITDIKRY